ncbi:hypothetical protein [Streptomyces sp. NPDC049949]|uniref:hypothetical protein n=1 Tax=Streptomyces sp. NPDC049949 TaxID=3154627 RepID=UPI003418BA2E
MKPSRMSGGVVLLGAVVSVVPASSPEQAAEGEVEIRHGILMTHSESCAHDSTVQVDFTFKRFTAEPYDVVLYRFGQDATPTPVGSIGMFGSTKLTAKTGCQDKTPLTVDFQWDEGGQTVVKTVTLSQTSPCAAKLSGVAAGAETTGWKRTETVLLAVGASAVPLLWAAWASPLGAA